MESNAGRGTGTSSLNNESNLLLTPKVQNIWLLQVTTTPTTNNYVDVLIPFVTSYQILCF
jgi:hypothetical protein